MSTQYKLTICPHCHGTFPDRELYISHLNKLVSVGIISFRRSIRLKLIQPVTMDTTNFYKLYRLHQIDNIVRQSERGAIHEYRTFKRKINNMTKM